MSVADSGTGVGTWIQAGFAVADALNRGRGLSREERAAIQAAFAAGYSRGAYGNRLVYRTPSGAMTTERAVIRAGRALLSGPSVADQMPPPSASSAPWYAAAVVGVARNADKIRAKVLQSDFERLLAKPLKLGKLEGTARKVAKLAKKRLPKLLRILRAPVPGAPALIGVQVAWEVGQTIGRAIYEAYDRSRYGPKPAPGAPGVNVSAPVPGRPAAPKPKPAPVVAPATPAQRGAAARARQITRERATATTAQPRVQPAPVVKPAPRPAPRPAPTSRPAPRPAPSKFTLPKSVQYLLQGAAVLNALPKSSSRSAPSSWPASSPRPAPLTGIQPGGLGSPSTNDPCRCDERRKRKSGKKACRNPIVSRRKSTRGGVRFVTITRRMQCQR